MLCACSRGWLSDCNSWQLLVHSTGSLVMYYSMLLMTCLRALCGSQFALFTRIRHIETVTRQRLQMAHRSRVGHCHILILLSYYKCIGLHCFHLILFVPGITNAMCNCLSRTKSLQKRKPGKRSTGHVYTFILLNYWHPGRQGLPLKIWPPTINTMICIIIQNQVTAVKKRIILLRWIMGIWNDSSLETNKSNL